MYANDYNSHYNDDYRRFGQSENYKNRQWYQHDNERVSVSDIFERSDVHNRNRHPSNHSDRSARRRSVKRYRRRRRTHSRHRSESSDRNSRRRYVKRNHHHRRTRLTKSPHRSESSDRSSRRRSVKRHHRRTRRDKKHRNRKRSHSRRYKRCGRSVERSRRHRGRHYCRCSSSSSTDRPGYRDRWPTRRDRYRYIYDRGVSGDCDRYEACNNYLRCGDERHGMTKGNEVTWQAATLQQPTISTFTQMPVPISTQPEVRQNAFMANDYRHHYSQIHPNLADYAYRVPAVYPSGMESQLCPAPSAVDEDLLPSISFISEMLKNDANNFVDSTPHNTQRIDQSNVFVTTENTFHIEPAQNDEENAVGLMDSNSGGNDMIPSNDDFVIADRVVAVMEAHNIRRCSVKLQQVEHPSTLSNQGTKEGAKRKRYPQEDCEQIEEMMAVPASTIKNNNPDWHSLDDKIDCKICKIEFGNRNDVVRHYIDDHPNDEVFPSRVAPDVAELLLDPKAVHDSKRIVQQQQQRHAIYKQKCYFCNTSVSKKKQDWITHMAHHTGYYRDKCTRCCKKFIRHRNPYCVDHGYVVREQSQRQFERRFKNDDVFAYVCGLCNYVRFDKASIKKHLNSQHDGDAENDFKEVIFLRFPKATNQHETVAELNESQPNNQEDDHVEAIIKNNNPDWHCLSSDNRCKICSCNIRHSLVNHYANVHPNSEVIPSRVSPDVGRFLRSLAYTAKCEISGKRTGRFMYKQFCYFCYQLKCCSKSEWIDHMIRHSGYYKYQCVGCSKKVVKPCEHVCDRNGNIKKLQQNIFDGEKLMAYLCDICNFVRFSKAEIENHLRNEHQGDMDDYEEIVFLSFPDVKRNYYYKRKQKNGNDETNAEDVIEGTDNGTLTPPLMAEERVIAEASTVTSLDIVPETELLSTTNENCHTSSPEAMENWIDVNNWDTCSSDFLE